MRSMDTLAKGLIASCLLIVSCRGNIDSTGRIGKFPDDYLEEYSKNTAGKSKIIELEYKSSFPSEASAKKVFLARPMRLARDNDGLIYVLDANSHCLFKFSPTGEYLEKIGRKGSGPGEFQTPNDMAISKDRIFVSDIGNYRIQSMDIGGLPQNTIKKYMTFYSMTCDDEGFIYGAPLAYNQSTPG